MNFLNVVVTVVSGIIIAILASTEGGNETDVVQVFQNGTDQGFRRDTVFNRNDEGNRQGKHYDEIIPCYDNYEKHIPRQRPCAYGPMQMKSIPVYQPVKYQYPIYQYPMAKYPTMAPLPVFKPVVYRLPTLAPLKSLPMPQYTPFVFPSLKPIPFKSIPLPQFKPLILPALKPFPTFAPMKSLPLPTFKPFVFPSWKPLPVKSFQFMPWVNPTFAPLKSYAPLKSLPVAKWPSPMTAGHKASGVNLALVTPKEHLSLSLPHLTGSTQIENVGNTRNSINITIAVVKNCSETLKDNKCQLQTVKDFKKQLKEKKFFELLTLVLGKNKSVGSKFSDEGLDETIGLSLNKKGKLDKGFVGIIEPFLNKKGQVDNKELDEIITLLLNKEGLKKTPDEQNVVTLLMELLSLLQFSDDVDFRQFELQPTLEEETPSNSKFDSSLEVRPNAIRP